MSDLTKALLTVTTRAYVPQVQENVKPCYLVFDRKVVVWTRKKPSCHIIYTTIPLTEFKKLSRQAMESEETYWIEDYFQACQNLVET